MENWQAITQDKWVLQSIQGIHLDLISTPVQTKMPNPSCFNRQEQMLIDKEVSKLLERKAISHSVMTKDSFVSNLFLVPKKGGEMRPVINLKDLNVFLKYNHFKMEGIIC